MSIVVIYYGMKRTISPYICCLAAVLAVMGGGDPAAAQSPEPTPGLPVFLDANFHPNPYTGDTAYFSFKISASATKVSLKIYSVSNRLVYSTDVIPYSYGSHESIEFSGLDSLQKEIANGVYFYFLDVYYGGLLSDRRMGKFTVLR